MDGPVEKVKGGEGLNLTVLTDSIGFRIHMLDLHLMRALGERCAQNGLTPASASVLMVIRNNAGVSHGELADALLIQRPNMTRMMRRLHARGLLQRLGSSGDRRRVVLALTPKGEEVIAAVSQDFSTQDETIKSSLGEGGEARLLEIIRQIDGAITLSAPAQLTAPKAGEGARRTSTKIRNVSRSDT